LEVYLLKKKTGSKKPLDKPSLPGSKWVRRGLILVVVGYVGILILGPVFTLIFSALSDGIIPLFEAITKPQVLSAVWMTFWIALIVIIVHTIFGTIVSWIMVRDRFIGRWILNGLIDIPFAVSSVVAGYMLLLLFGRNSFLAPLLDALGIRVAFAAPGMVLATLFVTLPFMIRELIPVLEEIGTTQEKAAATLGANGLQTFFRVTLPALKPGLIYGLTLTFARALGEFGAVLIIGGGIIGRTETLTVYIYRALDDRQYIGAYGAGLLLGVFSVVLVLGTDWIRRRKQR
jgi:sulfate/thiosulfate transport system permease protein